MSSIKKNFIYNIAYQILLLILPLITTPYISRVMGAEKIGIYSYSYSIAYYFGIFILLGLNNYGNTTIAKIRENKKEMSHKFWSIYFMQLVMGIIVSMLYFIYIVFFAPDKTIAVIQYMYLASFIFSINWFFFGIEQFKLTVTRNIIIKISTVLLIFLVVKNQGDLYKYAFILTMGTLLSEIALWPFLRKYVCWTKVGFKDVKEHIVPNLTLFVPIIAVSLYTTMDKIMLGMMSSMKELGFYENSNKLTAIPLAAINSLATVMLPRTSNMIANGKIGKSKEYIKKSLIFSMILSSTMAFGLAGITNEFVPIFYGDGYDTCKILIPILMISSIFISWANVIRTQFLIPNNKNKIFIISSFLGAIINIIANLILIPRLGGIGAAIGTLLAEMVVCLYQTYKVRKDLSIKKYIKHCIPIFLISMIMYICVFNITLIVNNIVTLIVKIIVGITIVGLLLSILYFKCLKKIEKG